MAKIVKKHQKSDKILSLISWKQIIQIYVHSLLIVFYIVLRNLLLFIKSHFDKRLGATRKKLMKNFYVLSSNADNSNNRQYNGVKFYSNRSICPGTQNSDLGEHKYIKVKQVRLHYVEKGEENSRVVLLFHGFPDCFFGWRNQISALSQKYRVIALDLKGFNDSDRPVGRCAYNPERICYEIKSFLDALDIKSVNLVGHDIGALIGWIFTLKYPDHVAKLFSISTPHPNLYWNTSKASLMSKYWFNMIQIPILPEKELSKDNSFIHETCKHLIEDVSSKEINRIVKYKQHNAMETYEYIYGRPEDFTGALNYLRNLMLYRVKSSLMIRCPCILIFGTENRNFGLDSAIKSAELCENPLVKIIDGAGYWPHQTHAADLNAILLKYLQGEKTTEDENDKSPSISPTRRGIVGRVMDKVYSVGQQYGI